MTVSPHYSQTDLVLAAGATAFTGLCVIVAEFNLISTVQEVIVFVQEIYNAREKYPNNSLIQAMTASFSQSLSEVTTTTTSSETTVDHEKEIATKKWKKFLKIKLIILKKDNISNFLEKSIVN